MNNYSFSEVPASQFINRLAILFAVLMALAVPTFYFLVNLDLYQATLQAETEMRARTIEERLARNPSAWEFELLRAQDVLDEKPRMMIDNPRYKKLSTFTGTVISEVRPEHDLQWPTVHHTVTLKVDGRPLAQLEEAFSVRALLEKTVTVTLGSIALFAMLLFALYRLTFRGLQHTERKLHQMAWFDALTSLPNRAQYKRITDRLLEDARISHKEMAVYFIDLDHFKPVNDTRGHHVGDALLKLVAQRIREHVSKGDIVMRFGGDEFVVVANNTSSIKAMRTAVQIVGALSQPFEINKQAIRIGASAGVSVYPYDAQTAEELLSHADIAMYQAKQEGRNRAMRYSAGMRDWLKERKRLEEDLSFALSKEQFRLQYQPVYGVHPNAKMTGVEALLRWERTPGETLPPGQFLSVLEETGTVDAVGEWVIGEAIRQLVRWDEQGLPRLNMSVNVAASQLEDPTLPTRIALLLEAHKISATRLKLEFTESALIADTPNTRRTVEALRALGLGLDVDDFGTGYSSFIYLKRYAISGVKIDRGFVQDMLESSDDRTIVKGIIRFAHDLNLTVTAEGVETKGQMALLSEMGCDFLQGYYFSKPVEAVEIEVQLSVI
jgi:diguanylate cyclase (GGDEF)-like protein